MPWIDLGPELGVVWVPDEPSLSMTLDPNDPKLQYKAVEPTMTGKTTTADYPTDDFRKYRPDLPDTPAGRSTMSTQKQNDVLYDKMYNQPQQTFTMPSFQMPDWPDIIIPDYPQYPAYPTQAGSSAVAKKTTNRTNKIAKLTLLSDQKKQNTSTLGSGSATSGKKKLLG